MNQNFKPILIALSVAAIVGGGLLWATSQKQVAANKTSSAPLAKVQNEGFVPGFYPGVMVRSVPLAKSQASAQGVTQDKNGLVRVLPGGQLPPRVVRRGGKSVSARRQGQSRKGGTAANLPEHRLPRVTAHRDKSGNVVID
jgi:hypothetical protein